MPYYEGASVLRGNSIYMTDYPYIKTAAKLKEFLQTIPSLGTPKSVSTRWLPKVGFKSANHRPIIRILDFIGFIKSNKPTDRWRAYQAEKYPKTVLAEGIADGYRELFKLYPDANQRSDAELKGYFRNIFPLATRQLTQQSAPSRLCVPSPISSVMARPDNKKRMFRPSSSQWTPAPAQPQP